MSEALDLQRKGASFVTHGTKRETGVTTRAQSPVRVRSRSKILGSNPNDRPSRRRRGIWDSTLRTPVGFSARPTVSVSPNPGRRPEVERRGVGGVVPESQVGTNSGERGRSVATSPPMFVPGTRRLE